MKLKTVTTLAVASSLTAGVAFAGAGTAQASAAELQQVTTARAGVGMTNAEAVNVLRAATATQSPGRAVSEHRVLEAIQVVGKAAPQNTQPPTVAGPVVVQGMSSKPGSPYAWQ